MGLKPREVLERHFHAAGFVAVPALPPEVVCQVIARVLEHVVVLVLDLSARPPGTDPPAHIVGAAGPDGAEGVADMTIAASNSGEPLPLLVSYWAWRFR